MPNDITGYLNSLPTDDNTRADVWDAYNGAKDQNDFQQRFGKLNIPDSAKADLWDSKYSNKPLTTHNQPQASNPSQPPAPQHQGLLSGIWDWANKPFDVGHIRENIKEAQDYSKAGPTLDEALNHPTSTLIKKAVTGFSGDAANMLLTPLSAAMAAAGPIARGTGSAATLAKLGLSTAGIGFGAQGVHDVAQHGITPQTGEKPEDYAQRVLSDAAMITGGAAGVAEIPHAVKGLRGTPSSTPPVAAPPVDPNEIAQARLAQSVGTPPSPTARTVHLDPKMADELHQFNQSDLPGKRVKVETNKNGDQKIRLAYTDPNKAGFQYKEFPDTLDQSVSDDESPEKVPVELSTQSADGKRGTSTPGHYLSNQIVGQMPIAAPETALPAPAAIPPTPSIPEAPATLPAAPESVSAEEAQKPSEEVVDSTPVTPEVKPTPEPPTIQEKEVVKANPKRGIKSVKLPTIQGEEAKPVPTELGLENNPRVQELVQAPESQAVTPPTDVAKVVAHEETMKPLIGEVMRLGQLRTGEQASHAIDIAMRESRDSAGSIPPDIQDKVGKLLNEKVGDRLTSLQMTQLEQRRGGTVAEEPKIKYMSQAEADRKLSDPVMGEEFQKQLERSQDDLLADYADPNISEERRAKLGEALQGDSKGRFKPFTYEHTIDYPRPVDLPSDHPEAPFAPKAFGHDITPINLRNLEAAIGKQPRDLFMSTSKSNPHISAEDLQKLQQMREGFEPGSTPSSDQIKDLLGSAEDDKAMSVQQSDTSVHAGSEAAEFERQLRQKALDNRQAKTLAVLKGKIGELKQMGGPTADLRRQLDALAPSVKRLLPKELYGEESTQATSTNESKAPGNEQPIKAANTTKAAKGSPTAGKPTKYEGIKTSGLESEILKQHPGKEAAIDMVQKGIFDRFPKDKRQKVYNNTLKTYAASLKIEDPYALKRGMDAAHTDEGDGEYMGMGMGAAQKLLERRTIPYTPEENRFVSHDIADTLLQRYENMSNSQLLKKKNGLYADSLNDHIDGAAPISNNPVIRQGEEDAHNELVDRLNDLKRIVGESSNPFDVFKQAALQAGAKDLTQGLLREARGTMNRDNAIMKTQFAKLSQLVDALPVPEQDRMFDAMSHGDNQVPGLIQNAISPAFIKNYESVHGPVMDANDIAQKIRTQFDAARDRFVNAGGNLQNFIVNYMPGMYDNQERGRNIAENFANSRSMHGDSSFLKQKIYEFHNQALAAGLQPIHTNPVDAMLMRVQQLNHATMTREFKNSMVDSGVAAFYNHDQTPPATWEKLNDPLFTAQGGNYWAPSSSARSFNNFTSKGLSGGWKIPGTNVSTYNILRDSAGLANQFQLGLSAFHGVETALNSGFSDMSTGIQQVTNQGKVARGVGNIIKGLTFVAPLAENTWHGTRGLTNYMDPTKAIEYHQLASDLEIANANVDTNPLVNKAQILKLKGAWQSALEANKSLTERGKSLGQAAAAAAQVIPLEHVQDLKKNLQIATNEFAPTADRANAIAKAGVHLLSSGVEAAAYPLMRMLIPRVKIGAFYKMANQIHEQYAGDPDAINQQLKKAWNDVDDRFGQVNYENMFMNRIAQDSMRLLVRSPGWNIGTARQGIGGLTDLSHSIGDSVKGKNINITNRSAYVASLVMGTMFINGVYQSLHPNAPAPKGIDYFFPQDGTKSVSGEVNRVYPKTYVYDYINVFHDPVHTVFHKAAPDISVMSDLIRNQDYYHRVIRDPGDNPSKQAASVAGYVARQFLPFSFSNLSEAKLRGQTSKAESFMGILPAPRWAGRTPAENLAYTYFEGTKGDGPQSPYMLERSRTFVELRNKVTAGTIKDSDIQDAIDSGKMNPKAAKYLYETKDSYKPQIQKWAEQLRDPSQVVNIWRAGNDEEKNALLPLVYKRVGANFTGQEQIDMFKELQDYQDKVSDSPK